MRQPEKVKTAPIVERRDSKPCVGTVAGQDVGNTGQSELIKRPAGRFNKTTERSNTVRNHTPGPWIVDADEHSSVGNLTGIYISQNGEGRIGQVFGNCLVTTEDELRANAALFAAAPDLLDALQYITDCNVNEKISHKDWKLGMIKARTAIRKARYSI